MAESSEEQQNKNASEAPQQANPAPQSANKAKGGTKAALKDNEGTEKQGEVTEDKDQKDTTEQNEESLSSAPHKARFGNAFEIDLTTELKEYSNAHVKAYKTEGLGGDDGHYFAMICNHTLTPRAARANAYTRVNGGPIAHLVASGVVMVPQKGEHYCFIYRDNLGQRIFQNDQNITAGWKAEVVLEKIVVPVIMALKDLNDVDTVHGNIRLSNFYNGGQKNYDQIVLGECLSVPPSVLQPPIYEPLHRCTAQPTGRGPGMIEDDLYALGVCIAMLMRTTDPMQDKSEDEIILSKIQDGTYATLIHKDDRFTGAILELLRGLLIDDQKQRWNMEDVLAWLDGRRLSPKQTKKRKQASRQLTFRGNGYFFMEAFANDMFKKPSEAVHLIECGELEQWLLRSLDGKDAMQRVEKAISSAQEQGKSTGYWDRLLARAAIALDPDGPIRYKDLALRPEGIGIAMSEAFIKNVNVQSFLDIFNSSLLQFWLAICAELNVDVSAFLSRFENCREYIKRPMIGYGLERCLYYMNQDTHCISPLLQGYFVRTPEDLLFAYNKMAKRKKRPSLMFDRHIAAFLSVKDGKVIDSYLYDLNAPEPHRKLAGVVNTLSMIQKTSSTGAVPALTRWICDSVEVNIARFHDKKRRDDIKKRLNKLRDEGDISKIVHAVDNPDTIQRDFASFKIAMHDYQQLEREHLILTNDLESSDSYGRTKGRQVAVIISGILAALIVMAFIMIQYGGGSNMPY